MGEEARDRDREGSEERDNIRETKGLCEERQMQRQRERRERQRERGEEREIEGRIEGRKRKEERRERKGGRGRKEAGGRLVCTCLPKKIKWQ